MTAPQQHFSKTRKIQRTLTKHLKLVSGLQAASKGAKTSKGWLTEVQAVSVCKPVKSTCVSCTGRTVQVLTLVSKEGKRAPLMGWITFLS